jgi:hypothetical protein
VPYFRPAPCSSLIAPPPARKSLAARELQNHPCGSKTLHQTGAESGTKATIFRTHFWAQILSPKMGSESATYTFSYCNGHQGIHFWSRFLSPILVSFFDPNLWPALLLASPGGSSWNRMRHIWAPHGPFTFGSTFLALGSATVQGSAGPEASG